MSTSVVTGEVRFSFPSLFEARKNDDGNDKYELTILIPKSDKATIKAVKAAVKAAAELGKTNGKFGGKVPANLQQPLRDGDEKADDYPEFEGHYFIGARSNRKPGIVDANLNAVIDPELVYPGVYGRVQINFYPYNFNGKKGVAAGLNNVQVTRDGERFGDVAQSAESVFSVVESDDYDDEDDDEDDDIL